MHEASDDTVDTPLQEAPSESSLLAATVGSFRSQCQNRKNKDRRVEPPPPGRSAPETKYQGGKLSHGRELFGAIVKKVRPDGKSRFHAFRPKGTWDRGGDNTAGGKELLYSIIISRARYKYVQSALLAINCFITGGWRTSSSTQPAITSVFCPTLLHRTWALHQHPPKERQASSTTYCRHTFILTSLPQNTCFFRHLLFSRKKNGGFHRLSCSTCRGGRQHHRWCSDRQCSQSIRIVRSESTQKVREVVI